MEGTKVYVPDNEHGWLAATLLSLDLEAAEVLIEKDEVLSIQGERRRIDLKSPEAKALISGTQDTGASTFPLQNLNVPEEGVEDMCLLSYLHEPAILYNLRRRFRNCHPYTYTGDICIAVNPYQWLDKLYMENLREAYLYAKEKSALAPHAYAISAAAYRGVRDDGCNQSILVSGESGAGKTETVKILMSHLASVCEAISQQQLPKSGNDALGAEEAGSASQQHRTIEKVLESNPLLESFGNAKTVRNDNSSRFGKFMQLQFQRVKPGVEVLVGSRCVTYLLEKSRVVTHSAGERNYHIFYQLLSAPEEVKGRHGLAGKGVKDFFYMAGDHGGSDTTMIEGRSDADRFHSTMHALGLIGVDAAVQDHMLSALAGILYLGQVEFTGVDGAGGEEARVKKAEGAGIAEAAQRLGCTTAALERALCHRTVKLRHESVSVPMTSTQALDARDALAKEVYSRLFGWLVDKINTSTAVRTVGHHKEHLRTIGLLDIFGFESFKVNRFEQLMINYANEKIQQKFTSDVFKTVQQEYEDEGITWSFIDFKDNAAVLDLIEGRMGIVTFLNEECILPKGGDGPFTSKLIACHSDHPHLASHKLAKMDFTIHHYAGSVQYTSTGFVARNKDTLQEDLQQALACSGEDGDTDDGRRNNLIRQIFRSPAASADDALASSAGGAGNKRKGNIGAETVTSKFKSQLGDLMESIASTRVQYIRCIKPNPLKSPTVMNHVQVIEQLRCAGVIEAIRISRAAYPNRLGHREFLQRFRMLSPHARHQPATTPRAGEAAMKATRELLAVLLPATDPLPYDMGKTKVYFRLGALESLEERRGRVLSTQAAVLQRYYRGWRQRHLFAVLKKAAVRIQSHARQWRQASRYKESRARVIRLQSLWRTKQARAQVQARRSYVRSTSIQAAVRGHQARVRYVTARKGVTRLQAWARMRRAKRAYKAALAEAKEQAKLENQLEALRRRLEEESEARRKAEAQLQEAATQQQQQVVVQQQQQQQQAVQSPPTPTTPAITAEASNLMEKQGEMLEYLKRKLQKARDQMLAFKAEIGNLKKDNESLRAENQRLRDAHKSGGQSFTALRDHFGQLQRINKNLMKEHQEAMEQVRKAQDEGRENAEKLHTKVGRLKEELSKTKEMYTIEVQIRIKQDRIMQEMVRMVGRRVGHLDPELFEELAEMQHTCAIGTTEPKEESGGLGALLGWDTGDHHSGGVVMNQRDNGQGGGDNVMQRASKSLFGGLGGLGKLF